MQSSIRSFFKRPAAGAAAAADTAAAAAPAAAAAIPPAPPVSQPIAPTAAATAVPPNAALDQLNAEQRLVVEEGDGLVSVEAGPGSGKTRVIAARVAHLRQRGVPAHRIAVLTFSNKACQELVERVHGGPPGSSGPVVHTFHSFCMMVLRRDGRAVGVAADFKLFDERDANRVLKQLLAEDVAADAGGVGGVGDDDAAAGGNSEDEDEGRELGSPKQWLAAVRKLKNATATRAAEAAARGEAPPVEAAAANPSEARVRRMLEGYQRHLAQQGGLDFDDLLIECARVLEQPTARAHWASRFLHVLVDEFQDTSALQCLIVAALASTHRNLMLVGDPQQCIYTWRNADRRNLSTLESIFSRWQQQDTAARGVGAMRRLQLNQSYRATERVLGCARAILESKLVWGETTLPADPHERGVPQLWTANGVGEMVGVHVYADAEAEARGIAHHISTLLSAADDGDASRLRASDFAVLARTGAVLEPIAQALKTAGVPCAVQQGTRLTDRAEVRVVLAFLELLLHPRALPSFECVARAVRGLGAGWLKHLIASTERRQCEPMRLVRDFARGSKLGGESQQAGGSKYKGCKRSRDASLSLCAAHDELEALLAAATPVPAMVRAAVRAVHTVRGCGAATKAGDAEAPAQASGAESAESARDSGLELLGVLAEKHEEAGRRQAGASGSAEAPPARESLRSFLSGLGLGGGGGGGGGGGVPSVSLCTVHMAKGLEWKHVWLAGVEGGMYPHARGLREAASAAEAEAAPRGGVEGGAEGGARAHAALAALLREERRLLFVAATRSRGGLVISRAMRRHGDGTSPSPFLRSLPREACEPLCFLSRAEASEHGSLHDRVSASEVEMMRSGDAASAWTLACEDGLQRAREGRLDARARAFVGEDTSTGTEGDECGGGGFGRRGEGWAEPPAPAPKEHAPSCRCRWCKANGAAQPLQPLSSCGQPRTVRGSLLNGGGGMLADRPQAQASGGGVDGMARGFSRAASTGSRPLHAPFKRPRQA